MWGSQFSLQWFKPPVVFLLTLPTRIFCCSSSLCVCVSYVTFMLSFVFPPHLSYFWCLGRAVLRDCGISWVSSLLFFDDSFPKISTRNDDIHLGLRWNFNVSAHSHTFCKHPHAIKVFRCQQCLYLARQLNTKVLMLEKAGSMYYLLSSFTGLPLPISIFFDSVYAALRYAGSPKYICMYMALSFILYVSSISVLWLVIYDH